MSTTKHVKFSESTDFTPPAAEQPRTNAFAVHPDRLAAVEAASSKAKAEKKTKTKTKTEAQRRYLKKKLDKRKKVLKAQKAAQPKNKDGSTAETAESAGTSAIPAVQEAVKPKEAVPSKATDVGTTAGEDEEKASDAGEEEESLEVKRAKRKAEKKAKREERRAREKELVERKTTRALSAIVASGASESSKVSKRALEEHADEQSPQKRRRDSAEDEESDNDDRSQRERSGSPVSRHDRTPSPETDNRRLDQDLELEMQRDLAGMPTFPSPSGPAKASAKLLSMQGLPAALKDAERVSQELRISIDDLHIQSRRKSQISKGDDETEQDRLGSRIRTRLRDTGVEEFFAVQTALLPELAGLPLVPHPDEFLHDYLVSAPTGSGKTLSYVVPLIEVLSKRVVTRLRALIILPTRDLVMQVRETLDSLSRGTGLKIGTATGQHSFVQEQAMLVADLETSLLGGSSKVDILIATPGRLMDHLHATPNFSLQHLRFLIIDEADRLLNQSFQDWLAQVLTHLSPATKASSSREPSGHDAVAASWYEELGLLERTWEGARPLSNNCQKLLFSATLTRDPSKIAALHLKNPRYFIVGAGDSEMQDAETVPADVTGNSFALPSTLTERMIILPSEFKPLNLLYLLHDARFGIQSALCFTKSVDSSERLLKLINFFEDAYTGGTKKLVVKGYSGELATAERTKLLADFKKGEIDLLICSDLIARGIDLPSVTHVISYDAPVDMRKYVHRVGRTARAGREGTAWTLVEKQEARHFKEMLSTANHLQQVKKIKIKEDQLVGLKESYDIALSRLKAAYTKA
ncbi:hypothetical protein QFC20_000435 [Naganishia adeliensis]|uniref:Uncharacterized protein n=1 Tax=Naganishia adeliensis TaxID=92952 RepID=A0ACC2X0N6_9TREE|nr:hypothetical protein QFC20_000435 [Naganishia adeliensis]